ncbi:MAG: S26 family signal peptidase [Candidatus Dormibacteria bacterium]
MSQGRIARRGLAGAGRLLQLVLVEGESMRPLAPPGAWLLVAAAQARRPALGRMVVVEHPQRSGFELVKRVSALSRERRLIWVAGDNPASSTDSDEFGPVRYASVRGWPLLRLWPLPPRWLRSDPRRLLPRDGLAGPAKLPPYRAP